MGKGEKNPVKPLVVNGSFDDHIKAFAAGNPASKKRRKNKAHG
jgi:hypothetical protein